MKNLNTINLIKITNFISTLRKMDLIESNWAKAALSGRAFAKAKHNEYKSRK